MISTHKTNDNKRRGVLSQNAPARLRRGMKYLWNNYKVMIAESLMGCVLGIVSAHIICRTMAAADRQLHKTEKAKGSCCRKRTRNWSLVDVRRPCADLLYNNLCARATRWPLRDAAHAWGCRALPARARHPEVLPRHSPSLGMPYIVFDI